MPFIRFWHHQKSSSETHLWRTEWEENWMGGGQEDDSPPIQWKKWKISPIKRESASSQECNSVSLWLCHALCSETLKTLLFFSFRLKRSCIIFTPFLKRAEESQPSPWEQHLRLWAASLIQSRVGEAAQEQPLEEQTHICLLGSTDTQEILLEHSLHLSLHLLNLGHPSKDLRTLQAVFGFKGSFGQSPNSFCLVSQCFSSFSPHL